MSVTGPAEGRYACGPLVLNVAAACISSPAIVYEAKSEVCESDMAELGAALSFKHMLATFGTSSVVVAFAVATGICPGGVPANMTSPP